MLIVATHPLRKWGLVPNSSLPFMWSRLLLWMFGIRVVSENTACSRSSVIVSNHVSYWDILTMMATCPGFFVSKASVRSWPLVGWSAQFTNTIFIERRARKKAVQILVTKGAEVLAEGDNVIVFPEGTTTNDPCQRFKSGAFKLAIESGRPVKPIAIYYDHMDRIVWVDDDSLVAHVRSMNGAPRIRCFIRGLDPLMPSDYQTADEMAREAQRVIQVEIDKLRLESHTHGGLSDQVA